MVGFSVAIFEALDFMEDIVGDREGEGLWILELWFAGGKGNLGRELLSKG